MRNVRAVVLTAALSLLTSFLVAAPASASPRWTPPEVLGVQGADVAMDVNASGDALAVWSSDLGVKASYRPAGQDWQHPVIVSRRGTGVVGAFLTDRGRGTAVWGYGDGFLVADRTSDGRWQLDTDAPEGGGACCWVTSPVADADEQGNLIVRWSVYNDLDPGSAEAVWRSPDGQWDRAYAPPDSMVLHDGVATFAQGGDGVYVYTARKGSGTSPMERIWPGTAVSSVKLAVNDRGDIVVAAVDRTESSDRLVVLTKPAGEEWRQALLGDTGEIPTASAPSPAIGDGGRVAVTYLRGSDSALQVVLGDVQGRGMSDPTTLWSSMPDAFGASAALTAKGDVAVLWSSGASASDRSLYAAYRPSDGPWTAPTPLARHTEGVGRVHAYPNGMFTALFHDGAAKWSDLVDDTVGPRTHMRAPRRDHVRTTRVPVRWVARDELARPDTSDVRVRTAGRAGHFGRWVSWQRDTEASHAAYTGKPGRTYCFSARSTDRVGNTGHWSSERCATTPVDDRAFAPSAGWSHTRHRAAYLKTLTTADDAGRRLRLTGVRAMTLRLLARGCRSCGSVRVKHGGRLLGVFALHSRKPRSLLVPVASYDTPRTGTVVVTVVGTGKPVRIDGLIASP